MFFFQGLNKFSKNFLTSDRPVLHSTENECYISAINSLHHNSAEKNINVIRILLISVYAHLAVFFKTK